MRIRNIGLLIVLVFAVASCAFAQAKTSTRNSGCASGTFTFKCPREYKVLLTGKEDRLFFANNPKYKYGVFVLFEPTADSMSESLPRILRDFLPKGSESFEWKDVEADPRKSSKYEVESKRRIAINNPISAYLTLEYRLIEHNGKRLLSGTITDGYLGPIGIRESFQEGKYTTSGACFDSVDIIAALTKEKIDHEEGPCFFTLTMSPGN
jgi:hypothetical protein